jgi:hypothetical protein
VLIRGRSCFLLLVAVVSPSCRSVFGPHEGSDRTLWKAAGVGWGTPAFDATTVYFVAFDHAIIAADKATGHVRWKATTDDQGTSTDGRTAVLTGNIVALGDRDIYGFDRGTGARRWAFHPQDGYLPGIFDLTTDGLTIFAGSPSGRVYAVDGASGASRWITILANDNNTSFSIPHTPTVRSTSAFGISPIRPPAASPRWTRQPVPFAGRAIFRRSRRAIPRAAIITSSSSMPI